MGEKLILDVVLKGNIHPGSVHTDFALVDDHIQFDNFGNPQVLESLSRGFHRIFGGFFPGILAGTNDFNDFVDAAVHRLPPF
jgi:hypothetical protein